MSGRSMFDNKATRSTHEMYARGRMVRDAEKGIGPLAPGAPPLVAPRRPEPPSQWIVVELTAVEEKTIQKGSRAGAGFITLVTDNPAMRRIQCFDEKLFEKARLGVGHKTGLRIQSNTVDDRTYFRCVGVELRGMPKEGTRAD